MPPKFKLSAFILQWADMIGNFTSKNFAKFWPKKYYFEPYKRSLMGKMAQIRQILKENNSNQIFMMISSK